MLPPLLPAAARALEHASDPVKRGLCVSVKKSADKSDARALSRTLRRTFGITTLREGQERVIERVLKARDTLAIMPTGAGKSLCYQLPALHLSGTTVVVSPLISLMKDQADKLVDARIPNVQLNSTLGEGEERDALARVGQGDVRIVFATPERMTHLATLDALAKARVALFVVDEAHCISQWGHDFRPAYLELAAALAALGQPPVLALTATATDEVARDIVAQLKRPAIKFVQKRF
jgi:ATP-dependent DNA helicase RecQ